MEQRLRLALAHRYGDKSERVQRLALDSGQVLLGLFTAGISEQTQVESAAVPEAEMTSGDDSSSENEKKKKKRKKKEHKPFDVSKLDRVVVSSSKFSDEARICKCCGIEMCQVTTQIQERIGFRPARLVVEVNEREVLACKACDTAPVRAPNLIGHLGTCKPAPSLEAGIICSKLGFGIPWNRLSRMLEDTSGMTLPASSWDRLTQRALGKLVDLAQCARRKVCESAILSLDDTFGKTLLPRKSTDDSDRQTTQAGRMWFALGDIQEYAFVYYTPNWKPSNLDEMLEQTKAQIQGDGYPGYIKYCAENLLNTPAGCMDHARRKFFEADKLGHKEAAPIIELMGKLYEIEAEIKSEGIVDLEEIQRRRSEWSEPIFDELACKVRQLHERRFTRDKLSRATQYFILQEKCLRVYLSDPRVPISNVHVERMIRIYAVMRSAAKLLGSPAAAQRMAAGLTIVVNAILAGVSLHEYFNWLFENLPKRGDEDLSFYLPQAYAKRKAMNLVADTCASVGQHEQSIRGRKTRRW